VSKQLTQPRVIKDRSSVNIMTSSSSSIVHVSLVECCLGINNVVTVNLCPLSFPSNKPQVSRFRDVFTEAMDMNLGRQSRGTLTFLSSRSTGSARALEFVGREMRDVSSVGGGGTDGGGAGRCRVGPGYPGYGDADVPCWCCGCVSYGYCDGWEGRGSALEG
jgi:hypothetical protein